MSNDNSGSVRLSVTILMAVELEYLLDLHIEFMNTDNPIRYDHSKGVANPLMTSSFRPYISGIGMIHPDYASELNFNTESNRPDKVRLLRSISSFIEALEAGEEDTDDLLYSFRDRLDPSKTQPILNFENRIDRLFRYYTQSIIHNLRDADLLAAFEELSTVSKIKSLNSIASALSYTESGTEYIKSVSTRPGELFNSDNINEIIDAIGVKVDEDANGTPVLSFAEGELGEQFRDDLASNLPRTNNEPIVSAFTLLSYFAKDVIPATWSSLLYRSTSGNSSLLKGEADDIVEKTFELLLPPSALSSFNEATTEEELIEEIEDFETTLGSMVGIAFDAMSIIAGVKSTFVLATSAINNQSPTAEDFKNALSAVQVINKRVASGLKNGSNREKVSKKIGYRIGYITLGIDVYIGYRNITYAAIYGENLVIIGNLLVVSGSAIPVTLGVLVRAGLILGGPKVWIASIIASTLSLIGGALISRGSRDIYEQFADYCYFGKVGITSGTNNDDPDHVAYNFDHSNSQIAIREQVNRMQTFLNPLGFEIDVSLLSNSWTMSFQHERVIDGEETEWLPRDHITHFDVGLVDNGGSHVGFIAETTLNNFLTNGSLQYASAPNFAFRFRNKWFQMTVVIGEGDDQVKLLEYDKA